MLNKLVCAVLLLLSFSAFSIDYPKGPDTTLTPGSLCDRPSEYRYPERIAYCERDVRSHEKDEIFQKYRSFLGYTLNIRNRSDYKIDHFIPLCAGGSNHEDNLWPQHISVFTVTDPIESLGCEKLKLGRIKQKVLIQFIKDAKHDLTKASFILSQLRSL